MKEALFGNQKQSESIIMTTENNEKMFTTSNGNEPAFNRVLTQMRNQEMLHYSARVRCGY
jgi:hypothetical protein